jgi:phosphoribosylformylglycinamidine synthase
MAEEHPSLTVNHLGRHVSCYVRTKVVSRRSPWLSECPLGLETLTPVSHGEGRFVASRELLEALFQNDQVATQYVDANGKPTLSLPDNPNGSMQAIEGITSPCGRIFGKMGHSERVGAYVGVNIPGNKVQPIFASGVKYFTE